MFDDQMPAGAPGSAAPPNLPVGEPEDIFGSVETEETTPIKEEKDSPQVPAEPNVPTSPPVSSALGAGVLSPKVPVPPAVPPPVPEVLDNQPAAVSEKSALPGEVSGVGQAQPEDIFDEPRISVPPTQMAQERVPSPQAMSQENENYHIQEPRFGRNILVFVIIIAVIGIVGFGGWWIYSSFVSPSDDIAPLPTSAETPSSVVDIPAPVIEVVPTLPTEVEIEENDTEPAEPPPLSDEEAEDSLLFGAPLDSDGDGLSNAREVEVGTDPENWDSDGDTLSDFEEVVAWKSNPLNPDTDGDGYADGVEVRNNYNPNGSGLVVEPPGVDSSEEE